MSGPLGDLRPADDGSGADWVFDSLHPFDAFDVGSVIPPGFEAYCCLLHADQIPEGEIPCRVRLEDLQAMATLLRSATSTPDRCWFCLWSGWGWIERERLAAPLVGDQTREYYLFSGPIDAVVDSTLPAAWRDLPSLWWPDDKAWIVASEIDLSWTYAGGSPELIDRVIAAWRFDGWRVAPGDPIRWDEIG